MNTGFYVQDERYAAIAWMWKSSHVQAFLRHPVFQGISASMYVDERYTAVTRMWKGSDVQVFLRHPVYEDLSAIGDLARNVDH